MIEFKIQLEETENKTHFFKMHCKITVKQKSLESRANMKKWLVFILLLFVVACGQEDTKGNTNAEKSSANKGLNNTASENSNSNNDTTNASDEVSTASTVKMNGDAKKEKNGTKIQQSMSLSDDEITNLVNSEMERLGYEDDEDLAKIDFQGDGIPEIVKIIREPTIDKVQIHEYNSSEQQWYLVYEDKSHENFGGFENLKILERVKMIENTQNEQVVLGLISGSGGFLNFYVLGDIGADYRRLYDSKVGGYFEGEVYTEDGKTLIVTESGDEVARVTNKDFYNVAEITHMEEFLNEHEFYVGDSVNGKADGYGKIYEGKTDHLIFEGEFKNNLRHGYGIVYTTVDGEDIMVYEGGFENGMKQGKGTEYDVSGEVISHPTYDKGLVIAEKE